MQEVWEHLKDMVSSSEKKTTPNIFRQFTNDLLEFCQDKSPDEVNVCACVSVYYKL